MGAKRRNPGHPKQVGFFWLEDVGVESEVSQVRFFWLENGTLFGEDL